MSEYLSKKQKRFMDEDSDVVVQSRIGTGQSWVDSHGRKRSLYSHMNRLRSPQVDETSHINVLDQESKDVRTPVIQEELKNIVVPKIQIDNNVSCSTNSFFYD